MTTRDHMVKMLTQALNERNNLAGQAEQFRAAAVADPYNRYAMEAWKAAQAACVSNEEAIQQILSDLNATQG